MSYTDLLADKVIGGGQVTKSEALKLYDRPLDELCEKADIIRRHFCSNLFDICTIINGKSGRCSENCKFCAQSYHNDTGIENYPLMPSKKIVEQAKICHEQGVPRYSIVTSGRSLSDAEVNRLCEIVCQIIEKVGIFVCASLGLLNEKQYRRLKQAGVSRIHNNLETSRNYFPSVCTTHTFDDKVKSIKAAQAAGLSVCSGGIMGLGETVDDRIDMAFSLRELRIKSVPVNMLNPINGTPYEKNEKLTMEDMRRIVAVYRFILPDASIRLAGGRGLLEDKGRSCFLSGANAAISGDMLTTEGITVKADMELLKELGYETGLCNE